MKTYAGMDTKIILANSDGTTWKIDTRKERRRIRWAKLRHAVGKLWYGTILDRRRITRWDGDGNLIEDRTVYRWDRR